jgi:hypothetical protein
MRAGVQYPAWKNQGVERREVNRPLNAGERNGLQRMKRVCRLTATAKHEIRALRQQVRRQHSGDTNFCAGNTRQERILYGLFRL